MQCMTMTNAQAANLTRKHIDHYLAPPTQAYRLQDWHKMEEIVQVGYDFAQERLGEWRHANAMPMATVSDTARLLSPARPVDARQM